MRKFLMLTVSLVFVVLSSSYAGNLMAKTADVGNRALFARLRANATLLTSFKRPEMPSAIINRDARRAFMLQRLKQHLMLSKLRSNAKVFSQFANSKSSAGSLGPSYHSWALAADADTSLFSHQLNVLGSGYYQMVSSMTVNPLPSPYHNALQVISVAFVAIGYDSADDQSWYYQTIAPYPLSAHVPIPDNSTASGYTGYIDWSKYSEVGFEWYTQYTDDYSYDDYFWDLEAPFTGHP